MSDASSDASINRSLNLPSVVAAVASVGLVTWLVASARRGLDLMDESYVLRLVADPEQSRAAGEVFLFPFLVHPVFEALGRDIAALRAITALTLAVVAAVAAVTVTRTAQVHLPRVGWFAVVAVSAAAATPVLTLGVRVPGYRVVTMLGLLLLVIGVALALRAGLLVGGVLVGVGGWVTFAGKPTSALAVLLVLAAFGIPLRLWRIRVLAGALCGLAGGLLVTLLLAAMSPTEAVEYLEGGLNTIRLLGAHSSLLTLLGFGQPVPPVLPLVFGTPIFVVAGLGLVGVQRAASDRQRGVRALLTTLAVVALTVALTMAGHAVLGSRAGALLMVELAVVVPLLVLVLWGARTRRTAVARWAQPEKVFVVLLLLCPYLLSVGSNVPLDLQIGQGVVFWVLAGVVVAATQLRESPAAGTARLGIFLLACAAVMVVVMSVAATRPLDGTEGRHGLQAARVQGGSLLLAPTDAVLATELRNLGTSRGVTRSTPVLDVSGISPGYALMLGGRFIGRAHFYAFLPGATRSASSALADVPCAELARAWVIRSADVQGVSGALTDRGLDLDRDYDDVYSFPAVRFDRAVQLHVLMPTERVAAALGC